jgi:glycosyltransferase involved in cell wall biosynthesis
MYPALGAGGRDVFGRDRLLKALAGGDAALPGPWEILFTLQDHFILDDMLADLAAARSRIAAAGRPLAWVGYWPVDSRLRERWVTGTIMAPDFPVLYTKYGLEEVLRFDPSGERGYRRRLRVIPHGVDCATFRPLPAAEVAAFRDFYFQGRVKPGTFLVVNVNRNQPRKDLARTVAAFALFHRQVPGSFLYLHAADKDAGGNLIEIAEEHGLTLWEDWGYPTSFDPRYGRPLADLNRIYNAADAVVTTTLGEGWGLSITEAMAAGTPVIAPHHTTIPELLGNPTPADRVRGLSVACGGPSLWVCQGAGDLGRTRPLTDVEDLVRQLRFVRENPGEAERLARDAHDWVQGLRWERIVSEYWLPLFAQAARSASGPGGN